MKMKMTRAVRDNVVHADKTTLLNERPKQVTGKLMALKKHYTKVHDHNQNKAVLLSKLTGSTMIFALLLLFNCYALLLGCDPGHI